jgi:hypothetical protein
MMDVQKQQRKLSICCVTVAVTNYLYELSVVFPPHRWPHKPKLPSMMRQAIGLVH